jgi:hypothetical protein
MSRNPDALFRKRIDAFLVVLAPGGHLQRGTISGTNSSNFVCGIAVKHFRKQTVPTAAYLAMYWESLFTHYLK